MDTHTSFLEFFLDNKARGIVFGWRAETSVSNILKIAFLVIGFSWPPIRWFNETLDRNKNS